MIKVQYTEKPIIVPAPGSFIMMLPARFDKKVEKSHIGSTLSMYLKLLRLYVVSVISRPAFMPKKGYNNKTTGKMNLSSGL